MVKLLGKKSKRCLNGKLHICIHCYPSYFEITLNISKGISPKTPLKEKNEKVSIHLVTKASITKDISISRKKSYRRDSDGNIKAKKIKISYTQRGLINGFLLIEPEFYMPQWMFKKAKDIQMAKEDFPIVIHEKYPRPSASRFVPYTTCRPNFPYRG